MNETEVASELELLEGETLLWSGAPSHKLAKRKPPWWRKKAVHGFWTLALAATFVAVVAITQRYTLEGAVAGIAGAIAVILALVTLGVAAAFLSPPNPKTRTRPNERYFATCNRLILVNEDDGTRETYMPGSLLYFSVRNNGGVHDVIIDRGHEYGFQRTLHALENADKLEKLLVEIFASRWARERRDS